MLLKKKKKEGENQKVRNYKGDNYGRNSLSGQPFVNTVYRSGYLEVSTYPFPRPLLNYAADIAASWQHTP
jgi:hypothetical protein